MPRKPTTKKNQNPPKTVQEAVTATKQSLQELHKTVAETLTKRLSGGEATAADISVAVKFLKDNGIEVADPTENDALSELCDVLPFGNGDTPKLRKASP